MANEDTKSSPISKSDSVPQSNGKVSKIVAAKNSVVEAINVVIPKDPIEKKKKIENIKRFFAVGWEYFLGKTKKQKKETKIFFGRKFIGPILLFLVYALVLMSQLKGTASNFPIFDIITLYMCLGHPYIMGISLVFTFLTLTILFSNTKIKEFIFTGKKAGLKQLGIYISLILIYYLVWNFLTKWGVNALPFLFVLAMFWLIFQGVRLYFGARTYSTKVEKRILKKYSAFRYFIVLLFPGVVMVFLTIISWAYRYGLVKITLDLIPFWRPESMIGVIQIYAIEIHVILPFLYISLISIFILISMEFILSRRRATTRRAGAFDNFTYSLIVFFMYFYLLYQISLYLFLNEQTTSALRDVSGAATGTSYLFWAEFIFSMVFLFRAIRKMGKSFGWNLLFLNQDAMVAGFLATVMAQTTSRLALYSEVENQSLGTLTSWLSYDHLLIPILIIAFLGITIVVYYLKPQETSMFMRIAKETIDVEDKSMEIVIKFLKREYIRRGKKYPVDEVEPQLLTITELPKSVLHSLLKRISDKEMDINMTVEEIDEKQVKFIDFLSITEKYENNREAKTRAQQYMAGRLVDTLGKEKKVITLANKKKKITKVKEREDFLTALGSGYRKKVKDEAKRKTEVEEVLDVMGEAFDKEVDTVTGDVIYEIIKREYIYRVSHPLDYSDQDCAIKISDIAKKVYHATKVSSGVLYPLMSQWAKENWNIQFLDEWVDYGNVNLPKLKIQGDHYIDFNPITDFDISAVVQKYRPRRLMLVRKVLFAWLEDSISLEKTEIINNIKITSFDAEKFDNLDAIDIYHPKNFAIDVFYYKLMQYFNLHFKERMSWKPWMKSNENLMKFIDDIIQDHQKIPENKK